MLYIVINCDILSCFSSKDKAINFVLDNFFIKYNFLIQSSFYDYNHKDIYKNVRIIKTEIDSSSIYEEYKFIFDEFNFLEILSKTKYSTEDKNLINKFKKLTELVKNYESNIIDSDSDDSDIYLNSSNSFNVTSEKEDTSDIESNININNDDIYSNNLNSDNIESQTKLLNELADKKRKLEKLNELVRQFNTDYDLYKNFKNKYDLTNVPEIFKMKFILFKFLENKKILDDKEKCKKIYITNFDKISKNMESNNYQNLFNQTEVEEIF